MSQNCDETGMKYQISKFATSHLKDLIIEHLSIDPSTYSRKVNARIGDSQGFEACQMLIISSILNRPISSLISKEAWDYYISRYSESEMIEQSQESQPNVPTP